MHNGGILSVLSAFYKKVEQWDVQNMLIFTRKTYVYFQIKMDIFLEFLIHYNLSRRTKVGNVATLELLACLYSFYYKWISNKVYFNSFNSTYPQQTYINFFWRKYYSTLDLNYLKCIEICEKSSVEKENGPLCKQIQRH